jgi:hypothetical protein
VRPAPVVPTQPAQPRAPVQPQQPERPDVPAAAVVAATAATTAATLPGPAAPAAAQTTAVQPGAIQPGAPRRAPQAKKAAPSRTVNPGDKVCGQCGEGNPPVRNFCRRCGASLTEAVVFTLPWYKRWWQRLTMRKQRAAGDRPKTRRRAFGGSGPGWLGGALKWIILAAVIVLALLIFVGGPFHSSLHRRVMGWYHDINPKYTQVHAVTARASTSAIGHPPRQVIDGAVNTCWQSAKAGAGQLIILHLASPTNVGKIGFLSGDQDSSSTFLTQPRPKSIEVVLNGSKPERKTITLKDQEAFQSFSFGSKGTTVINFEIKSLFPSTQGGQRVSIAEIETYSKN